MVNKFFNRVKDQIPELETKLAVCDVYEIEVSAWSVANHLEHVLRAHIAILQQIEKHFSHEPEKGKRLTLLGRFVLLFGRFPKGFAKAPNLSAPRGCTESELRDYLTEFEATCERLQQNIPELTKSHYAFPHPFFGQMSIKQWLRLIEVHTRHHLRIIENILEH